MQWIHDYQLFLFDFDGVLVDTEALHFKAYTKMCSDRGFSLNWDLHTYARYALISSETLREALYGACPALKKIPWEMLYAEKKAAYGAILNQEKIELMPGVEEILVALKEARIKHCVVTHTDAKQAALIRKQIPLLDTIPFWITREDYNHPKPASDCYQLAVARHAHPQDRIIGFEDSPRGLNALLGITAEAFLISSLLSEEQITTLKQKSKRPFSHFNSFGALASSFPNFSG